MIVAVLAGGRGSRLGGAKPTAVLGGEPLLARVLRAASGFEPVVVAKRDTVLPPLDVPVWIEPDEPFHPLTGLVTALERGPCVAVACDQPWVTGELLSALMAARAVASVNGEYDPFPGYYDPAQLPVLREALTEEAGLRRTLARLAPPRLDVDPQLVASVNTPEALAAAERRLSRAVLERLDAREAQP
ncbi:NTP transferase domain-containing protein [Solirubrobacter ginsenosidimutans]|uniref:NTP transferase domain-containing protein n=1 Tax=Solirubrobacter ginsenosidimutans TaxID=490573 RepID=A0A9X3MNP2_9ACTN|nr:NTP transferase domain-containing protein [Solirubrobacter ginsenosidimutans]MDA0159475.1 NTP transferase domain-containing protein [Solirubrobacter ginsenosidimutans]